MGMIRRDDHDLSRATVPTLRPPLMGDLPKFSFCQLFSCGAKLMHSQSPCRYSPRLRCPKARTERRYSLEFD